MPWLRAKTDDVVDGEEIGRILALRDEREFVGEALPDRIVDAVGIALGRALQGEMLERFLRRGKALHLFVGIFVLQFVEREGERIAQAQRFRDRLRPIAEQPRHFRRRLQMALGIGGEQPAGAVDGRVLADAGEHIRKRPPLGMMIVHVVDRDQRHAGFARSSTRLASRARSLPR